MIIIFYSCCGNIFLIMIKMTHNAADDESFKGPISYKTTPDRPRSTFSFACGTFPNGSGHLWCHKGHWIIIKSSCFSCCLKGLKVTWRATETGQTATHGLSRLLRIFLVTWLEKLTNLNQLPFDWKYFLITLNLQFLYLYRTMCGGAGWNRLLSWQGAADDPRGSNHRLRETVEKPTLFT